MIDSVAGARRAFTPNVVVAIKALACELPSRHGLPLARWSVAELRQEAVACGIVAQISGNTLWRWLGQDALRPWRHRSWIFPRDPQFARKAGRVIDLYQRRWKGAALGPRDYVLCIVIATTTLGGKARRAPATRSIIQTCHRRRRAAGRLRSRWSNVVLVHTPVHASWLNQIEVYFSIVQHKLLTPSDFQTLVDLKRNVMAFQARYQRAAKPFKWTFTRRDLHALLAKLKKRRAKARKLRQRNTSP